MKTSTLLTTLITLVFSASLACAQEPAATPKKPNRVGGHIKKVTDTSLEMGTKAGPMTFTLAPETKYKFLKGKDAATIEDLRPAKMAIVQTDEAGSKAILVTIVKPATKAEVEAAAGSAPAAPTSPTSPTDAGK